MDEKKEQLKKEILKYLNDHPRAGDTVKGIVEWWLLERTIKRGRELVQEALNALVADGLIIAKEGPDSQIRYKINRRRRKQIISELKENS